MLCLFNDRCLSEEILFYATYPPCSVADPGCLSRILIFIHPRSWISDPKITTKERDEKKFVAIPFCVATNFKKLKIILFLKCRRKKIWASFLRIIELFIQKFVTKLSKYGFVIRDPVSEIWDPEKTLFRIPDPGPGVKKAPDPGSTTLPL
jgi:hypothetical protein